MTETYNGAWDPVKGDVKEVTQDVYHRYPVNTKPAGVINKPMMGAYQVREVNDAGSMGGNGK